MCCTLKKCWWTERPGMLQFMGSQRVRHDWATELNWTESQVSIFALHCRSVVSNSLWPHGQESTRYLCPWHFPRQEYWSGLPFLLPGDLPDLGIEQVSLTSPALADTLFTTRTTWEIPFWTLVLYMFHNKRAAIISWTHMNITPLIPTIIRII